MAGGCKDCRKARTIVKQGRNAFWYNIRIYDDAKAHLETCSFNLRRMASDAQKAVKVSKSSFDADDDEGE